MNIRLPLLNTRSQLSGAALVVTLAILVLLLGLTIGLFLTANSELRSASLYKNSQGVRELADTSVNLVQAQIKDATLENATAAPGSRSTWASQPGMIRTYGSGTNATRSYKLYSWADPRPAGDAADSVPADWWQNKALYTDINEPVPDSEAPSDTNAYRYPIAYPPIAGANAPLGYSVTNAPVSSGGSFTNSVPMPVQWLYVLRDGASVSPSAPASPGTPVTVPGAGTNNPIVGRIAYWTDDEATKVNINTAAGGPFWMRPVFATLFEQNYANYQPMQFEFQRFPGHPARTDLRAVFPDLSATDSVEGLYAFAPRIQWGGSMKAIAAGTNAAGNTNAVIMDSDRLFASIGEARFSPASSSGGNRSDFLSNGTSNDRTERNKFLLTSSSRSPELTLYGTPRLSIWPEPADTSTSARTPYDSLIALCATLPGSVGNNSYYFDRANALSATDDISSSRNTQLLGYIDQMMATSAIPGTASSGFPAKGDAADRAQIQTEFFDYIRCVNLTDTHPQTGNNISYSLAGIVAPSERTSGGATTRGFGRFYTLNQFGLIFAATADYANPASNVTENKSLQSAPGVSNAVLLTSNQTRVMALPVLELAVPAAGCGSLRPDITNVSLRIRGLEGLQVTAGAMTTILGLPASSDLGDLPGSSSYNLSSTFFENNAGGYLFHTTPLRTMGAFKPLRGVNGFTGNATDYPVSSAFTVPTGSSMTVSCANPILVDIVTSNATQTITIPPFSTNLTAPSLNSSNVIDNAATTSSSTLPPETAWAFHATGIGTLSGTSGRTSGIHYNTTTPPPAAYGLIYNNDSILALATKSGDYRLVMVNPNEGTSNFSVVPALAANSRMRHRFSASVYGGAFLYGANMESNSMGIMKPRGNSYRSHPMLPSSTDYPTTLAHPRDWGDFDNGYPPIADGPYINKPDEGEILGTGGTIGTMPYFGQTRGNSIQNTDATTKAIAWSSPSREITSPVAFGSLPSAMLKGRPWQNLLFRPALTSSGGAIHPGAAGQKWDGSAGSSAPPDHYLLDYFWMPIVEPWAISECFSTAGKINMNYRIAPFDYIKRKTAIHALLNTEVVPAVPSVQATTPYGWALGANGYAKTSASGAALLPADKVVIERECNVPESLKTFESRLDTGKLFRSPTEICELALVPKGVDNSTSSSDAPTSATISNFWSTNKMTGDNLRELPYNNIYPRLTTKSNTYTVHYRVQVLKKLPGGDQEVWDETKDKAVSELRGSTLIERYLDPNASYPDYATTFSSAPSLEASYRFRVLQRSDFTP